MRQGRGAERRVTRGGSRRPLGAALRWGGRGPRGHPARARRAPQGPRVPTWRRGAARTCAWAGPGPGAGREEARAPVPGRGLGTERTCSRAGPGGRAHLFLGGVWGTARTCSWAGPGDCAHLLLGGSGRQPGSAPRRPSLRYIVNLPDILHLSCSL